MVEKSQDIEMDKSVAVGNVENNSEKHILRPNPGRFHENEEFVTECVVDLYRAGTLVQIRLLN